MTRQRLPFPLGGRGWEDLKAEMTGRTKGDVDWRKGRTPLFVFYCDDETYEVGKKAFFEFFTENALGGKRAFHSIGGMERDILDFGLSLFDAPAGAEGAFTTGGSESIFLALKAARDKLRAEKGFRPGEDRLNLVMGITAHPGFDKAAQAMDIEIRRGPTDAEKRIGAESLRGLIDDRTIAIVGSAPCFPHGVVDRIDELSDLALDAGVWLHVDACVGGWLAPWFTTIGRSTPRFDFRFPGVRSISADLHKFGFCPKPASTVFYRDADDLERAKFDADAWPNGRFVTATLAGTRPGGAVAASWAVLNHLGESGYCRVARNLSSMIDAYVEGVEKLGYRMIAKPDFSIINYTRDDVDVFAVAELMTERGWLPGLTRNPKGFHSMMSMLHDAPRQEFLDDLAWATDKVMAGAAEKATIEATY